MGKSLHLSKPQGTRLSARDGNDSGTAEKEGPAAPQQVDPGPGGVDSIWL